VQPTDFLLAAEDLLKVEEGEPRQANLREACSATYYAIFHTPPPRLLSPQAPISPIALPIVPKTGAMPRPARRPHGRKPGMLHGGQF
jgi:hypothetical protein